MKRTIDACSGNYYYRARVYSAQLGRFLGRDPLEADINLYRYCANNPVLYVDPTGEDWLDCMSDCIKDNDPIDAAVAKALLLVSGTPLPKAFVAGLAEAVGDTILARQITAGRSAFTTIPSVISARLRLGGRSTLRLLGRYAAPVAVAYGLALAAVEVHCAGYCTTICIVGCCNYDSKDGNFKDAIINQYFN